MFANFRMKSSRSSAHHAAKRRPYFVPQLLRLEDRTLPSTFTVMNLNDSGPNSLRAGIASGDDTVNFAAGLHGTITLGSTLVIDHNVAINGPGAGRISVSGNNASEVFDITAGSVVSIAGLMITRGSAAAGGGIDNAGVLTLDHDTISNNQAIGGLGGGGVLNEVGASLTMENCLVNGNKATAATGSDVFGGGLLNEGTAAVTGSTFSGNQALGGSGADFFGGSVGGAIDNFGGATLDVSLSAFSNNQAVGVAGPFFGIGGAIENNSGFDLSSPSTATINMCTFVSNLATGGAGASGNGGALDNEGFGATMTLTDSTLAGNQSVGGPGGDGLTTLSQGEGGGILNLLGTLTVTNTAFLGNKAIGGSDGSNTGAGTSEGVGGGGGLLNALGNATLSGCTFAGNQAIGGASAAGQGGIAQGAGILNTFGGTTSIDASTFFANVALGGAGASGAAGGLAAGGGIDNYSGSGDATTVTTVTVTNTTFLSNQALGGIGGAGARGGIGVGGAIAVGQDVLFGFADSPTLTLGSDTLAGNLARGGLGGSGGTGGDGLGGGLGLVSGTTSATGTSFLANFAVGGNGSAGGNGGDGLGGGLYNNAGASLSLASGTVALNLALGGVGGTGGSDGQGIGGGVYTIGTFNAMATFIKGNHASTMDDNVGP